YALVEPGVTYAQLHEHLKSGKPRLWLDCASSPTTPLVSDTLARSFGYTPYGDHVMMQCGMEVVLPDGSLVRTGMGAMPKSSSWQLFKYGYGPYSDGSFTQSSLGIVTKMGIWLMPAPPVAKPFMITVPHEADLHQVMEILKPLKVTMAIPNTVVVAHILNDAALAAPRSKYFSGAGRVTAGAQEKIAADLNRGVWNIYGALYGLPPGVNATWKFIQASFQPIAGVKFYSDDDRKGDIVWEYRAQLMRGAPANPPSHLAAWNGGGHAELAQAAPITGDDAVKTFQIAQKTFQAHRLDYLGSFSGLWRSILASNTIAFDPASADQRVRARDCANALIHAMASAGYGAVSASPELHSAAAATYSADNGALWRVHGRLKNEFDPSGVIAPGIPVPQKD
ncbi:MAG: FAD-binding oxidoreductase, partial [Candidatus Binataceae bacterium]